VGAGGKAEALDGSFEEFFAFGGNGAIFADQFGWHLRVRIDFLFGGVALGLDFSRAQNPFAHGRRTFHLYVATQFFVLHRRNFDVNIDAVEQRAGNFRNVALNLNRGAMTFAGGIAEEAAGAGVHRGGEHEARGEIHGERGAGDGDGTIFEGLAHDFQHVALKFGKLVEKQNAGRGIAPPPIKPASLMVWCGER